MDARSSRITCYLTGISSQTTRYKFLKIHASVKTGRSRTGLLNSDPLLKTAIEKYDVSRKLTPKRKLYYNLQSNDVTEKMLRQNEVTFYRSF